MPSLYRVFAKEIRLSNAHHFLCQTDKTKSRKQAREEFIQAGVDLINWGINFGYDYKFFAEIGFSETGRIISYTPIS
ncbi:MULTISPECIES: hypothetical protein [Anoxybacillaceae]|jgi:hypothetical protein|uniref:hypothetical protein n=1 Tax=Anoxybacillaceae TaxID=3120669 RepID=UPI0020CA8F48|nr:MULTISPECIES: hypothetical protein [Bacillaceae]MED4968261.1 hypothetical protein [Parageobacillus toebii]